MLYLRKFLRAWSGLVVAVLGATAVICTVVAFLATGLEWLGLPWWAWPLLALVFASLFAHWTQYRLWRDKENERQALEEAAKERDELQERLRRLRASVEEMKEKLKVYEPPPSAPEPPVPRETVERLRELYAACSLPIGYALEYLAVDVMNALRGEKALPGHGMLARLLDGCVVERFRKRRENFSARLEATKDPTESEFHSLRDALDELGYGYSGLLDWIIGCELTIRREEGFGSPRYRQLYIFHSKLKEKLEDVRGRTDLVLLHASSDT